VLSTSAIDWDLTSSTGAGSLSEGSQFTVIRPLALNGGIIYLIALINIFSLFLRLKTLFALNVNKLDTHLPLP
jgi:hypothetical protein